VAVHFADHLSFAVDYSNHVVVRSSLDFCHLADHYVDCFDHLVGDLILAVGEFVRKVGYFHLGYSGYSVLEVDYYYDDLAHSHYYLAAHYSGAASAEV
jgi:hypothetical protein